MKTIVGLTLVLAVISLSRASHAEPTHAERAACQIDAFKYCTHAIPDRDSVRACLRQNMRRLNATCRGAIQRSRK